MIQYLVSVFKKKDTNINSDTVVLKLVNRVMANILLGCLLLCTYITMHEILLQCGGNSFKDYSQQFVDETCWEFGLFIYANVSQPSFSLEWNFEHDLQYLNPGMEKKSYQSASHLTIIHQLPQFFMISLILTICGGLLWSSSLRNYLRDLTRKVDKIDEDKNWKEYDALLSYIVKHFKLHMRSYNKVLIRYIGCLLYNITILTVQNYVIVSEIGRKDLFYPFKALYFSRLYYGEWPDELVTQFPISAHCHFRTFGPSGNLIDQYYICTVNWGMVYSTMIASIFLLNLLCIVTLILSVIYYVLFTKSARIREAELGSAFALHTRSKSFKSIKYLNPGSAFILVLLHKNTDHIVICHILESLYVEFIKHPNVMKKYLNGMTTT